jgi:hypothetical protein
MSVVKPLDIWKNSTNQAYEVQNVSKGKSENFITL